MSKQLVATAQTPISQQESRDGRIKNLSSQLRERFLVRLHNEEVAGVLAEEIVATLRSSSDSKKHELILALLERLMPRPVEQPASAQPTLAIQINNSLKRGKREFA